MGAPNKKQDRTEAKRLEHRAELAGQVIKLPREWQDATNPENPFALNPHYPWIDEHGVRTTEHPELAWFKWAMVLDDGTLLKAFTRRNLLAIRGLALMVGPTLVHFGVALPAVYETPPWKGWERIALLSCAPETGRWVAPPVVLVSPGDSTMFQVYCLLRAAAWFAQPLAARGPAEYKLEARRRHGEMLEAFLQHGTLTPEEALRLEGIPNEFYPPSRPIRPDGREWNNGWSHGK